MLKEFFKKILPKRIIQWLNKQRTMIRYKNIKSNKDLFTKIYSEKAWGDSESGFNSGSGSNFENSQSYIDLINKFMDKQNVTSVVDVGCGDWRVSSRLNLKGRVYVGCDIVEDLIRRNSEMFSRENISFKYLDIVNDEIPAGDLLLIRQVFQHLTNLDISKIIEKLKIRRNYKYAIVTDELPNRDFYKVNPDVLWGGTRIQNNGGLQLEKLPFNVDLEVLLDVVSSDSSIRLRTVLLKF